MTNSIFNIQYSKMSASRDQQCFTPHSALRTPHSSRGFTYIALLAAIVIIGISLGAAGKYWQNVMMREKEEELLFRGEQYRLAIERYYLAFPGRYQYPQNIDDLLTDSRSATGKRHLRQKFKDPITNDDFEVIRDQTKGNRITGVYSSSDKEPLKKTVFPELYTLFENKKAYKEWKFVYTAPIITVPAGRGYRTGTGTGQAGTGPGQTGTGSGQAGSGTGQAGTGPSIYRIPPAQSFAK
jgi:type II secretory pathway pseudopilin PulG